ncbi:DinB family protein [Mucilaginibacter panaciglaebae]|uniref:DinB-like domain-containing protein n=1 Tax=Mucilaginibacter panaciglaebae TaxID=502331 RepID=A0ABP7WD40_9SPHI
MADKQKPEVWLRGALEGIPPLLQPVAHALLQAREEVNALMADFPEILLWVMPVGMASPGFHLQHLAGVLDRLFTYARGETLTEHQLNKLALEGKMPEIGYSVNTLLEIFNRQVDDAVKQLSGTDELTLTDKRGVGRAQLPSTVIGLYTHAAEHIMRHLGQLLVTSGILRG